MIYNPLVQATSTLSDSEQAFAQLSAARTRFAAPRDSSPGAPSGCDSGGSRSTPSRNRRYALLGDGAVSGVSIRFRLSERRTTEGGRLNFDGCGPPGVSVVTFRPNDASRLTTSQVRPHSLLIVTS